MTKFYVGWELPEGERNRLLALFPPAYPDVIAHHVTLAFGVQADTPLPTANRGTVVGMADNGESVQALVLEIDGTTERPDGKVFHITWSLDRSKGAKPVHSNEVIRQDGYAPVPRIPTKLEAKLFS